MKKLLLCLFLVLLTGCSVSEKYTTADPQPSCGSDGPPWILHNITNMEELRAFVDAAEAPETAEQWIDDNWNGSWAMLSGFEEMSELAEELKRLPFPSVAEAQGMEVEVYPDYGRDYVMINNKERTCFITIHMNPETENVGTHGRLVIAENFQKLFDQTGSSWKEIGKRRYEGQADGYWISFDLLGYDRKEALGFLRDLQFETLSEDDEV